MGRDKLQILPTLLPAPQGYGDLALNPIHKHLGSINERNSMGISQNSAAASDATLNRLNSNSTLVRRAKVFADQYRKNPDWLFTTPQQRFDFLYTGRFAYGSNERLFYSLLDELNKKAGYCKITATTKHVDDLMDYHYIFLYQKHWRYTDALRNKMQWWSDTGLPNHWIKSYQPSAKGCLLQDYKKNVPSLRVITLKDLSSAFVLLLMGFGISFLVFLIEKVRYKIRINRG